MLRAALILSAINIALARVSNAVGLPTGTGRGKKSMLDLAEITIDAPYVNACLDEAGATLLALPSRGFSTRMSHGGIEFVREAIEAYGWTEETIKPPVPSSLKIDEMDRALQWLGLIPVDRYMLRRIVGCWMLVHPVTEKRLFSWRRIGATIGCDYRAVQRWHAQGIDLIIAGINARNNY